MGLEGLGFRVEGLGLVKGLGLGFRDYVAKAGIVAAKHCQVNKQKIRVDSL